MIDLAGSVSFNILANASGQQIQLEPGRYIVRTLGNVLYIADGATVPGVQTNAPGMMFNEYPLHVVLRSGTATVVNPSGSNQQVWFGRCE